MPPFHSARRAGYSRLQAIFAIVVTAVLLAGLSAELAGYLKLHSTEHAVESARTLDTLLAQYATDNDGVYPVGEGTRAEGKSEGIALDLLLNNYTPNADLFTVGWTPRYSGTAKDYADLAPENLSWDFTAGADATTGIKSDAPDWLPVLYTTGETVDYTMAGNHQYNVEASGNGPFGHQGIIAAYKGGDVRFMPAKPNGPELPLAFFCLLPGDKNTGTYTQIKP
jgi:hypothetical protein